MGSVPDCGHGYSRVSHDLPRRGQVYARKYFPSLLPSIRRNGRLVRGTGSPPLRCGHRLRYLSAFAGHGRRNEVLLLYKRQIKRPVSNTLSCCWFWHSLSALFNPDIITDRTRSRASRTSKLTPIRPYVSVTSGQMSIADNNQDFGHSQPARPAYACLLIQLDQSGWRQICFVRRGTTQTLAVLFVR
jgi:hypothetical protein